MDRVAFRRLETNDYGVGPALPGRVDPTGGARQRSEGARVSGACDHPLP